MLTRHALALPLLLAVTRALAGELPPGTWPEERSRTLLDKTRVVRLAPDLGSLSDAGRCALAPLLDAGHAVQEIYEDSLHPEALEAARRLRELDGSAGSAATRDLLELYRLFSGPIATDLENELVRFLPVAPEAPTRNVYPPGADRGEIDAFLAKHPEESEQLLAERTVVRRTTPENVERDLATLARHPVLDALHPGLRAKLESLRAGGGERALYAVPQSVRWADGVVAVSGLLERAAGCLAAEDPELARYLRNRSRDLLSDDYESGDASWVTGRFGRLNVQVGSYETYDDKLLGVKAFFGMSVLVRDEASSRKLEAALRRLQELENAMPYERKKRVREDIPIGVYQVVADFGQARGQNTASILPNDPLFARRYGRTILMRENILRDETIFSGKQASWKAAMAERCAADLTADGDFHRTLWHEVGHYLGVDRDRRGRPLPVALRSAADTLEELKADLASLHAAPTLRRMGYYPTDAVLRSVQAEGIRRTLQKVKPRRDQPYQTMQLVQLNWFLERGLLSVDASGRLAVHYRRYPEVVAALLREVLAIQWAGDPGRAEAFIDRWTAWTPELHERLARRMREAEPFRYVNVRYAALGE